MIQNHYRFKLGQLACVVVSDGLIEVPPPPSAPPGAKGEQMEVLCLVMDSGDQKILIDTGCGPGFQGMDTGKLPENLQSAGIQPESIDIIIFTHGHSDHAGGAFDKNGNAVFPNARYIVAKSEWQCWVDKKESPEMREMFIDARRNFLPIPDQFHLAEEGEEVVPGIILTTAPGHTPGNTILRISSGEETLTYIGDLIHSTIEFSQPDFYTFLDTSPQQAIQNRTDVLTELAKTGDLAFVCHFPFPGLGNMVDTGSGLGWKPRT